MSALSMLRPAFRRTHAESEKMAASLQAAAVAAAVATSRAEVVQAVRRLGLLFGRHPDDAELPLGDFVVAAYRGGWQACEGRMDSPDMADAIATALETPSDVLEQLPNESLERWKVRAVRQVVAYGLAKR